MSQSRILIVEDDHGLREAIVDTLMLAGYECLQEVSAEIRVVPRNFRSRPFVGRGLFL